MLAQQNLAIQVKRLLPFRKLKRRSVAYIQGRLAVNGVAMLVSRQVIEATGGFDDRYFIYGEESDLCFRARRAGRPTVFSPAPSIVHAHPDGQDRPGAARRFEEAALRFKYATGVPEAVRISHFNLANYILREDGELPEAVAHRLAALLIAFATQSGGAADDVGALSRDLQRAGPADRTTLLTDFSALCDLGRVTP